MKALQSSAAGKRIAALLLIVTTFFSGICAFYALAALPYMGAADWQQTGMFQNLLLRRENNLASHYANCLTLEEDADLSYVERQRLSDEISDFEQAVSADTTWFRYQIRTQDGQKILESNLTPGELLEQTVQTVHYASFVPGEHRILSDDYYSYDNSTHNAVPEASAPEDDPSLLFIECGVPAQFDDDSIQDEFSQLARYYESSQTNFSHCVTGCILMAALAIVCVFYLLWAAGHTAGREGITLSWQERVWFDLYLLVMVLAGSGAVAGILVLGEEFFYSSYHYAVLSERYYLLGASLISSLAALLVGALALTLRTLTVRLKAGCLLRTTLICFLIRRLWQLGKDLIRAFPFLWRVIGGFLLYFFLNVVLFTQGRYDGFVSLLWWLLNLAALALLCWWSLSFRRLRQGSQAIASGNLSYQIDTHRMPHDLKEQGEDLNNISSGLAEAVDEKMKSERFKAELITNVSHDLKTPLTSIINYVDLLKTTQQSDPKAVEYIEVLDRKSQRLKKLTEDLVEASKASTGVLSVSREKIGMAQLVDQALGEWAEKLEERNLTVVTSQPEGETWVYADGRHLWRVMDNLLSNCAKYALEGTRIYLDLSRGHGQVVLSVKNISREALNVPPEQLMERFVRGEESRTTDGSGLGLSIARSLTELQGGTFELAVDGDLFKATVSLPQSN